VNVSEMTFGLPLLTKDMIEQAAQRRTYVLRVIYAAVLYGAALWIYADISGGGAQAGVTNLGRGQGMFQMLVKVQLFAILVLLPAISCGAITSEKERDTLGLLLLTQLGTRTIILEKLASRLVTMATYQLMSLPLFAVVYGLGGVELVEILMAIWFLMLSSLVVGAISIYFSSWHSTTAGAFMSTYALMPFLGCFGGIWLSAFSQRGTGQSLGELNIIPFLIVMAVMSIPAVAVTIGAIASAQQQLLIRAFVPPRNVLLEMFKKLDAFFEELNQQTTRGVVLVRDHDTGPRFAPVAWRETRKKSLGTVRYLFRFLVLLEVPLAISISWTVLDMRTQSFDGPTAFFLAVLWPIAVVAIAVHTTNVLASERSRQTLDVLLVAPLSPADLVGQKLAGVRRLIGMLSVPFTTLVVFQAVWTLYVLRGMIALEWNSPGGKTFLHEVLGMAFAMIVYPRVIQWIAFHLILRLKNQTQAVLSTLAVVITICGLPYLIVYLISIGCGIVLHDPRMEWLTWFSPIRVLFHRQIVDVAMQSPPRLPLPSKDGMQDRLFLGLGLHVSLFLAAWVLLRHRALRDFSGWIGRTEPTGGDA